MLGIYQSCCYNSIPEVHLPSQSSAQKHMLGTDQVLNQGRYRIISSFGQNGSGGIYEAYDTVSDKNVVLSEAVGITGKVASAQQLEAIKSAFVSEAKVLSEIRHESLVSVQDYFSELDRQYLVLESVTGYSLAKFIGPAETKPALADVLSWAEQVLGALQYLHRRTPPVIHGDIRPENIKLTSGLKVKLLTTKISTGSMSGAGRATDEKAKGTAFNYRPLEQIWPDLDPAIQKAILDGFDEKAAGLLMRPPRCTKRYLLDRRKFLSRVDRHVAGRRS
jgi:serine/threonine protein kinase